VSTKTFAAVRSDGRPPARTEPSRPTRPTGRRTAWIAGGVAAAIVVFLAIIGQTDIHGTRLANPLHPHAATITWLGLSLQGFWLPVFYVVTLGLMALMIGIFVRHRRKTAATHPGLPIFLALYAGFLIDPIINWGMYAVYYPGLVHWPVHLPFFDVSPSVEPFWIVMGAYQVFFLAPAMGLLWLFRRFVSKRAIRHQLLVMFIAIAAAGCLTDIGMESWMMNYKVYVYTQIAGPVVGWGQSHLQLYEVFWVGLLIGFYAVLMVRDDGGRTPCMRLSRKRIFTSLRLGETGTAFVIVLASLMVYTGFFCALRLANAANNVVIKRYPYPSIRTYDPNGLLRKAGLPGPYYTGTWCDSCIAPASK
jgi:hypothetical protein